MKKYNLTEVMTCLFALDEYIKILKSDKRREEIELTMTWFENYNVGAETEIPKPIRDTAVIALKFWQHRKPSGFKDDIIDVLKKLSWK